MKKVLILALVYFVFYSGAQAVSYGWNAPYDRRSTGSSVSTTNPGVKTQLFGQTTYGNDNYQRGTKMLFTQSTPQETYSKNEKRPSYNERRRRHYSNRNH